MRLKFVPILFIFCLLTIRVTSQDISDANMKAVLIYQFAKYIIWENEESLSKFRIGIYGVDDDLYSELKIVESMKLKQKSVEIIRFNNIEELDSVQMLYVTPGNNIELKKIKEKLSGSQTLLISDQCKNESIVMINFLPLKGKKVEFEVNKANIYYEQLVVLPELLLLGGTEIDIAELYKESQKSLQEVNLEADRLSRITDELYSEIELRNIDISTQNEIIQKQKALIKEEQERIDNQEINLKNLINENRIQQEAVDAKVKELLAHEIEIENQKNEIREHNKLLSELHVEANRNEARIAQQKSELVLFRDRYQNQKTVLIISLVALCLALAMAYYAYRAYKIKKDANVKIYRQKEEIMAQAEELKQANEEVVSTNEALESQKEELTATLEDLKKTQSQLVQTAKMASLGKLTAGVAHELNNPINFINGNISPLKRDIEEIYQIIELYDILVTENKLEETFRGVDTLKAELNYRYLVEEINNLMEGINEGATRTSNIVSGLRSFSRLDEEEFKETDIHELIESTLTVLKNKTKNRITLHKRFGEVGLVECLPSKLNQVFMNILMNAIQAIEGKGEIFITTSVEKGHVKISIRDTGAGISAKVKKHLFEPFYTTKEVGQGTGLGLSISFGIIKKHEGDIEIVSEPGNGAEFVISFPTKQTKKKTI